MTIHFKEVFFSFKDYARLSLRLLLKLRPLLLAIYGVMVASGLLAWFTVLSSPLPFFATLQQLAASSSVAMFGLFLPVLVPFAIWRGFRRTYQSTKFLQAPASYTFSPEGIQVESPLLQGQASWQTATRLYLLGPYAVLMTSTATGYFLNFDCLVAPATMDDFKQLVAQHGIPLK